MISENTNENKTNLLYTHKNYDRSQLYGLLSLSIWVALFETAVKLFDEKILRVLINTYYCATKIAEQKTMTNKRLNSNCVTCLFKCS